MKPNRNPDYKKNIAIFTLGDGLSRFGSQFNYFAVSTLTYGLTHSPIIMALQIAVCSLAIALWAPKAGKVADRFDPRAVLIVTSLLRSIIALAYINAKDPYAILILNFIGTSVGTFGGPARTTLLPRLSGKNNILSANGMKGSIASAFELFGPGLAGITMTCIGIRWAFIVDSLSFLFPCLAMALLQPFPKEDWYQPGTESRNRLPHEYTITTLMRRDRQFALMVAAQAAFTMGMWGVNSIFFPFVKEFLHRGPEVMGWMISAYYGAGLVSGVVVGRWGKRVMVGRIRMMAYACGGAIWLLYLVKPSVAGITFLSFLDGIVFTLVGILFETTLQQIAPSDYLGRIAGGFSALMEYCSLIGILISGSIATWVSIPWAYVACATFTLAIPLLSITPYRTSFARTLGIEDLNKA